MLMTCFSRRLFLGAAALMLPIVASCSNVPTSHVRTADDSFYDGAAAHNKGRYDVAITCFTEAIGLDPQFARAY